MGSLPGNNIRRGQHSRGPAFPGASIPGGQHSREPKFPGAVFLGASIPREAVFPGPWGQCSRGLVFPGPSFPGVSIPRGEGGGSNALSVPGSIKLQPRKRIANMPFSTCLCEGLCLTKTKASSM